MLLPEDNLSSFVLELEGTDDDGLTYVLDIRRVQVPTEVEPNDDAATANDLGTVTLAELPLHVLGVVQDKPSSSGTPFSDYFEVTLDEALRVLRDQACGANLRFLEGGQQAAP